MPRLLMMTPRELTRDPRARRAVIAAQARGFEVIGVCGAAAAETPVPLGSIDVVRVPVDAVSARLRTTGLSVRGTSGAMREIRGIARVARNVALTIRLSRAAAKLGRFDVVHAHDLDALPAGWFVSRRFGARLVYDVHELYSSQEPDPPRIQRAVLGIVERLLARRTDAMITVNEEIADEVEDLFALRQRPIVVLSASELVQGIRVDEHAGPLRAIYQGAMGPGRSIDDLLAVASKAPTVQLSIRVAGADLAGLRKHVQELGLDERVDVLEPVSPDELVDALVGFDVGLVINRPVTRNDELVLPNKFFEYLMAGLAVVGPRLPSLAGAIERERVGLLFEPGHVAGMAAALERLADDRRLLMVMRVEARQAAVTRLNAEAQRDALVSAWGLA